MDRLSKDFNVYFAEEKQKNKKNLWNNSMAQQEYNVRVTQIDQKCVFENMARHKHTLSL